MAINVNFQSALQTIEPITLVGQALNITHTELVESRLNLSATTTPPVTQIVNLTATIGGGGTTNIDLTALTGTTGAAVVTTGLKLQFAKLSAAAANVAAIVVSNGASNSYAMWGATYSKTLKAGQTDLFNGNNATPAVGSGAKNILLTGTAGDVLYLQLIFG